MTLHGITLYLGVALAFVRWRALGNVHSALLQPKSAWYEILATFLRIIQKTFQILEIFLNVRILGSYSSL